MCTSCARDVDSTEGRGKIVEMPVEAVEKCPSGKVG
jgi:hypothetical protein